MNLNELFGIWIYSPSENPWPVTVKSKVPVEGVYVQVEIVCVLSPVNEWPAPTVTTIFPVDGTYVTTPTGWLTIVDTPTFTVIVSVVVDAIDISPLLWTGSLERG